MPYNSSTTILEKLCRIYKSSSLLLTKEEERVIWVGMD